MSSYYHDRSEKGVPMAQAFGIKPERSGFLKDYIISKLEKSDTYTEVIEEIEYDDNLTMREKLLLVFMVGGYRENQDKKKEGKDMLKDLLKGILGDDEE